MTRAVAAAAASGPLTQVTAYRDTRLDRACGALLGVDALFIAVFLVHGMWVAPEAELAHLDRRWHIGRDRSYAETFGYLKLAIILSLLLAIGWRWRRLVYVALTPLFGFALVDDAFQGHERIGRYLAGALELQPLAGLRGQDLGELTVWAIAGAVLLSIVLAPLARSAPADRVNGLLLLGAFTVLVMFAVVADMMHLVWGPSSRHADLLFAVVEEGGEQIALSLTCGLTVLILRELGGRGQLPGSLRPTEAAP